MKPPFVKMCVIYLRDKQAKFHRNQLHLKKKISLFIVLVDQNDSYSL